MKLSIITTIGNEKETPNERGDKWQEALECYCDLADEVIVVDGSSRRKSTIPLECTKFSSTTGKVISYRLRGQIWPYDWSWEELPMHLNAGLEAATGDWVIKMDIDQLFHEDDFKRVKAVLEEYKDAPVLTFEKRSFTKWNRYYQKGKIPIAINKKKFGNKIRYGHATNKKTDLCYPIFWDGDYKMVKDWFGERKIPQGVYNPADFVNTNIPIYNYDYTFKTKEQTFKEFWRFSQAYHRYFGEWKLGATPEDAFSKFMEMMEGRKMHVYYDCRLEQHPKFIQKALGDLAPEQFGYNGFGIFK